MKSALIFFRNLKSDFDGDYLKNVVSAFSHGGLVSEIANEISIIRKNNAEKLINEINKHLKDLQLENTKFEIEFSKENEESSSYFKNNGVDLLEFLVSFNKGEDVKRLGKIASGGELSRFMLAIKTITSQKVKNQTLIFDEIDTGVSGEIAYKIAEKIKEISNYSQVLCVTHLPQVAAISDHHYNISKNIVNDKTVTNIETLSYERRVQHIAGMISKGVISEAAVLMAKELLK